ncbi:UPF0223 family protein [Enterococcus sp. LJL90]
MEDYQYPLDLDWQTAEMVTVIELWQAVELAYEKGIENKLFLMKYQKFKQVVPSIGEEKKLGREFEGESGYSLYRTVQAAKQNPQKILRMKGTR